MLSFNAISLRNPLPDKTEKEAFRNGLLRSNDHSWEGQPPCRPTYISSKRVKKWDGTKAVPPIKVNIGENAHFKTGARTT
jgi:hypothetical protein